jgi:hypothetical protein
VAEGLATGGGLSPILGVMDEPTEEIDDDENRPEENPDPNAGPSVAGLLLICLGVGCFVHPPLRTDAMNMRAVAVLNWPIAGAMVGAGIGAFLGNGRRCALYGIIVGVCITALFLLNGRFNPIGH